MIAPAPVALLPDRVAPSVSRFRVSRRRFRVQTAFRFRVSEPARVRLTIRRGARRVRSLVRLRLAGEGLIRFTARAGKRPLRSGRYRATLVARDRAGNLSRPRVLHFRVLP